MTFGLIQDSLLWEETYLPHMYRPVGGGEYCSCFPSPLLHKAGATIFLLLSKSVIHINTKLQLFCILLDVAQMLTKFVGKGLLI